MSPALQSEIDRNFDQFQRSVGALLPHECGKFALMRAEKIIDVYASVVAAERAGMDRFSDGIFSIQEITDRPVDLGFFTHAIDPR